ncbi:MAG: SdrD B-like domain-containing protein [Chloroflexota bacterium]
MMVVETNDAFLSPDEHGIRFVDAAGNPRPVAAIEAAIRRNLAVWDAGTEANEVPGVGINQAPRQAGANTGDDDPISGVRIYSDPTNDLEQSQARVAVSGGFADLTIAYGPDPLSFVVTLENTSDTTVYPGVLTPMAWAVHDSSYNLFTVGEAATPGLESLSEDGDPATLIAEFEAAGGVLSSGVTGAGPITAGGTFVADITVNAAYPYLTLASMIVPSNDTFLAFGPAGINLLDENGNRRSVDDIAAEIAAEFIAWDAGVERNQAGAAGPDQPPRQAGSNTGADEGPGLVLLFDDPSDDPVWDYPETPEIARITLMPLADVITLEANDELPDDASYPATEFLVRLENISGKSGIPSPFSPGVWAVHDASRPLFTIGRPDRGQGLEAIAEDGNTANLVPFLGSRDGVASSGVFNTPVDGNAPGPILPGQAYEFMITTTPDAGRLSFATMLVQSNDIFAGPVDVGIKLFDSNGDPISGDISDLSDLWDAGTERNEALLTGPNQVIRQGDANTGPGESGVSAFVNSTRSYPTPGGIVDIAVTEQNGTYTFVVTNDAANKGAIITPIAPIFYATHDNTWSLFTTGAAASADLETLAEDGSPAGLVGEHTGASGIGSVGAQAITDQRPGDDPGPAFQGESFTFNVTPSAQTPYLTIAMMVVESNDVFLAFSPMGVNLMDDQGNPRPAADVMDDVERELATWDAGTEANEVPGVGPNQAPRQAGPNTGPADPIVGVRIYNDSTNDLDGTNNARVSVSGGFADLTIEHGPHDDSFTVTLSNTSGSTVYPGILTPVAYATHNGLYQLFEVGKPATPGLEALAEDGDTSILVDEFGAAVGVGRSGVRAIPVGADAAGPIADGGAYRFIVTPDAAHPYFSLASMIVPSNDTFLAFGPAGVRLLDENGNRRSESDIAADIAAEFIPWDAGTERNQAGAAGPDQPPRQADPNTGDDEGDGTVRIADIGSWTYLLSEDVLKVTITPQQVGNQDEAQYDFTKTINDNDANALANAVLVNAGETLKFEYILENTGSVDLLWNKLSDSVFDSTTNLSDHCGLPLIVPAGFTQFCEFNSPADNVPDGLENIASPEVYIANSNQQLDPIPDNAWYRTSPPDGAQFASIGDMVWADVNINGIQDDGEPGFPGIQVELLNLVGEVLDSIVTDSTGAYRFFGVEAGSYRVRFTPPDLDTEFTLKDEGGDDALDSDANPSSGRSDIVTVAAGEYNDTVDAGFVDRLLSKPGTIGNFVWEDLNGDGVQDDNEPGVADVKVELFTAGGTLLEETTTDSNGLYLFTPLAAGQYQIVFTLPNGFSFTLPNQGPDDEDDSDAVPDANGTTGTTDVVNLGISETNLSLDAGLIRPASLGDFVWNDLDGDGIQDDGEPGIEDATVTLYSTISPTVPLDTDTTGADGIYGFDGLMPGDYFVIVELPDGFIFTDKDQGGDDTIDSDVNPATGTSDTVTLDSGENDDTVDAGAIGQGSISGQVFDDQDGDGIQDPDEPGVSGVTVTLLDENGDPVDQTPTDENGNYTFDNIPSGTYTVVFEEPDGTDFSPQDQGGPEGSPDTVDSDPNPTNGTTDPIVVNPGDVIEDVDAGLTPLGSIGDTVWSDLDGDGIQDGPEGTPEPGVGGVAVQLYLSDDTPIDSTTTGPNGIYLFDDVPAGDYYVIFTAPDGFTFSPQDQGGDDALDSDPDPTTGQTATFPLGVGEDRDDVDAGIVPQDAAIDVEKTTNGEDADEAPGPVIPAGDAIAWAYTVSNVGDAALTNIVLTDDQEGVISCPQTTLASGESMVCTANGIAEPTAYENTATVSADVVGQPNSQVSDSDMSHYTGASADLEIVKMDSEDPATAGEELFYTIVYTNNGPTTAFNVQIQEDLPLGVLLNAVTSADPPLGSPTPVLNDDGSLTLIWSLAELAAGQSGEIVLEVDTDPTLAGSDITNVVSISSDTPDPMPEDNQDTEPTTFEIGGVGNPTAIELLSFTAFNTPFGVDVRWVTGAEIDTNGFNLYRSTTGNRNDAVAVTSSLIEALGFNGGEYRFVDSSAVAGVVYTYWLVETENDGTEVDYGPVQIQAQDAALSQSSMFTVFLPVITR